MSGNRQGDSALSFGMAIRDDPPMNGSDGPLSYAKAHDGRGKGDLT
jgi:hypothetical protein